MTFLFLLDSGIIWRPYLPQLSDTSPASTDLQRLSLSLVEPSTVMAIQLIKSNNSSLPAPGAPHMRSTITGVRHLLRPQGGQDCDDPGGEQQLLDDQLAGGRRSSWPGWRWSCAASEGRAGRAQGVQWGGRPARWRHLTPKWSAWTGRVRPGRTTWTTWNLEQLGTT